MPVVGDLTAGRRQSERLGFSVELSPGDPRLSTRGALDGIDPNTLHCRQIDHQPAIADRVPGDVVAAAAHRHQQPVVPGEIDRPDHVRRAAAAGDQCRPPVDHAIPDPPRVVIAGIVRSQQRAAQRVSTHLNGAVLQNLAGAIHRGDAQISHGSSSLCCTRSSTTGYREQPGTSLAAR
jgi:hypothetical protein